MLRFCFFCQAKEKTTSPVVEGTVVQAEPEPEPEPDPEPEPAAEPEPSSSGKFGITIFGSKY